MLRPPLLARSFLLFGSLCFGLPSATSAPVVQAAQDDATDDPYKLLLWERFKAEGAEPYFWEVQVRSNLTRLEEDARVRFEILLEEFDIWLGEADLLESIWPEGVEPVVISQDPTTQQIATDTDARSAPFLDGVLATLSEPAVGRKWSESVPVFDGDLIPGMPATQVETEFSVSPIDVEGLVFLVLNFDTEDIEFDVGESRVQVSYHGFAVIDEAKQLVYHSAFLQEGFVETSGARTDIWHCMHLKLADDANEPILPEYLFQVSERYDFLRGRPENDALQPEINEQPPKPKWVPGTWLTGRYAHVLMGAVAEGRTNPLPVVSLGSVYLADTAIAVGGSYHLLLADVDAGEVDLTEADVADYDFNSLRRYLFGGEEAITEEDRGPELLPPGQAKGAVRVGDRVIPVGMTGVLASQLLLTKGGSSIAGAVEASYVKPYAKPAPPVVGAAIGGTLAALGVIGVGTVSSGGDDPTDPFPFTGQMTGNWAGNSACATWKQVGGNMSLKIKKDGTVLGVINSQIGNIPIVGRVSKGGSFIGRAEGVDRGVWVGTFKRSGNSLSASGTWSYNLCAGGIWQSNGTATN